jgi:hypothetical protein
MATVSKHYGVLFNRNSGAIVKVMDSMSSAMLRLWGIQGNVSKSRDFVVFDAESGLIDFYCEGKGREFPTVHDDMKGKHIDEIAEGLLEALNAEN